MFIYDFLNINYFLQKRLEEIKRFFFYKYYIDYFSFHIFNQSYTYYFNQNTNLVWHNYNWRALYKNCPNILTKNNYFLKSIDTSIENHEFVILNNQFETCLYQEIINEYKEFTTIGLKNLNDQHKILITFSFLNGKNINQLSYNKYNVIIKDLQKLHNSFSTFFNFFIKHEHILDNKFFFYYFLNEDKFIL